MERTPQGGDTPSPNQALREESYDDRLIRTGIEEALRDGTDIDDRTAARIASQLYDGQGSALYSLASTGNIAPDIHDELTRDYHDLPEQAQAWTNWLGEYCLHRPEKGPVSGWRERTADPPAETDVDAEAHAEVMARIRAAGITTLGQVATVTTAEQPAEDQSDDCAYTWEDAMRWYPDDEASPEGLPLLGGMGHIGQLITAESEAALERLDGAMADEAIGSVDELGWFALFRHDDGPGGVILAYDQLGSRHVWETDTDEALEERWQEIKRDYRAYDNTLDGQVPGAVEQDDDQPQPQVYVVSLADYTRGQHYGVWLDATLDTDELHDAIQFMLRNSYVPGAEEWAIHDHSGFHGLDVSEYEGVDTISRLAKGIEEHGEPFARWAGYLGTNDMDEVERTFQDHYLGRFDSTEAYVEYILQETEAYRYLEAIPNEELRQYASYDTEAMARDWEVDLYIVESGEGGVLVFDGRT
jgi:antirestriction protein